MDSAVTIEALDALQRWVLRNLGCNRLLLVHGVGPTRETLLLVSPDPHDPPPIDLRAPVWLPWFPGARPLVVSPPQRDPKPTPQAPTPETGGYAKPDVVIGLLWEAINGYVRACGGDPLAILMQPATAAGVAHRERAADMIRSVTTLLIEHGRVTYDRAVGEGEAARLDLRGAAACPYGHSDHPLHGAWMLGWQKADAEMSRDPRRE